MFRRTILLLVPLALLAGSCVAAVPEAGVKGSGAIAASDTSIGVFEIAVGRSGDVLFGGLKYQELDSNATIVRPMHVIYSQAVTSLVVTGSSARIQAVGYWNGMPSDITVECKDNPSGVDWFSIVARPRSMLTIIYVKSGDLIKGDIVVFGSTTTAGYAAGQGAIAVGQNLGAFAFKAQVNSAGVAGYAHYAELTPAATSISRPPVRIYLPKIEQMSVQGNMAVFGGRGTFNGMPALIQIKAVDNAPSPIGPVVPDEFYITARLIFADAVTPAYSAGGPLVRGDLVVVPLR